MTGVPPPTTLPSLDLADPSGRVRPLGDTWASGPALVLVGHTGCDTTRFTLPFVDRIHRRRGVGGVAVVLQDEPEAARELIGRLGLQAPVLLETAPYPLASALGLTVVPTLYLVAPGGAVEATVEAFQRDALERAAARLGVEGPLFSADDGAPSSRPG
jgi:hypothetical protein